MKKQKELSKKGLINLVLVACTGYVATAGIVGSALFGSDYNTSATRVVTASMSSNKNTGPETYAETGTNTGTNTGVKIALDDPALLQKPVLSDAGANNITGAKAGNNGDANSMPESLALFGQAENEEKPGDGLPLQLADDVIAKQPDSGNKVAQPKQAGSAGKAQPKPFKRKFDQKILEAAAERAGEKIGDLRGSLDEEDVIRLYKAKPQGRNISTPVKRPVGKNPVILQRPAWKPEDGEGKSLPPIVFDASGNMLDTIATGSLSDELQQGGENTKVWELRR